MPRTRDATQILDRVTDDDEELEQQVARETLHAQVAQLIYLARTAAGLTQAQLAARIGTQQPVMARLEDADYEGHSLSMVQRIAAVLHQRIELRFVPAETTPRAA